MSKEAVLKRHKDVPFRLLEPVPELSCGPADAGNLIVQGDNLHALKALGEVVGKEGLFDDPEVLQYPWDLSPCQAAAATSASAPR